MASLRSFLDGMRQLRLFDDPQIGFQRFEAFGEANFRVFIGQGGDDDNVIAVFPIHGGGDFVVVGELQAVHHAEDFLEIPAGGRWVGENETDFLVRVNHENRADGDGGVSFRVNHAIQVGDFAVVIGENGEI